MAMVMPKEDGAANDGESDGHDLEDVDNGYGGYGKDGGNGKSTGDGETRLLPGWRYPRQ